MAKLSIVVLQYNKSEYTLNCLEALREFEAHIIVVDNNSDVQHVKNVEFWIASRKMKNYELLMSNENLGYSGGNNLGIKKALANGAEEILILNNDVILHELPNAEGDIIGVEHGHVFGFSYLSGAVLLIKKEVFNKIGLLDERYFLYYEDVEFCVRAQKAGFTLAIATPKFQHAISATTSSLGSANLLYYHTRNTLLLFSTHGSALQRFSLPIKAFWIMLKQRVKIFLKINVEESKAILQGVIDYNKKNYGKKN